MKALCIMEDPVIMDIDIMEDAHTALQAMAGTPCAELVETYHWMWEKYKTDSVMIPNLKTALKTCGIGTPGGT